LCIAAIDSAGIANYTCTADQGGPDYQKLCGETSQTFGQIPRAATVKDNTEKNRSVAYKMLAVETFITVVTSVALYLTIDMETAKSVAIGGLAFIVPNAYFAKYVFRHSAADSAELAMRWFYIGEVIKVFATVLIFSMGFLWSDTLNEAALFMMYIVMLVVNIWGNSILMSR
jgi:ATP synthase protein I